jgi:hypothetical protein
MDSQKDWEKGTCSEINLVRHLEIQMGFGLVKKKVIKID